MALDKAILVKCCAPGCSTSAETQINGKRASLFPFPTDETLAKSWEYRARINSSSRQQSGRLYRLCELHFGSNCFQLPDKTRLKPDALPSVFELNRKRRIEQSELLDILGTKRPKQLKLSQQLKNSMDNIKLSNDGMTATGTTSLHRNANGSSLLPSVFMKQIDMGKKVYRLMIRIDKVSDKSARKSQSTPVQAAESGRKYGQATVKSPEVVTKILRIANKAPEIPSKSPEPTTKILSSDIKPPPIASKILRANIESKEISISKVDKSPRTIEKPTKPVKEEQMSEPLEKSTGLVEKLAKSPKFNSETRDRALLGTKIFDRVVKNSETVRKKVEQTAKNPEMGAKAGEKIGEARNQTTEASVVQTTCAKLGCKLTKTTLNGRSVFQCERCQKYYVVKQNHSAADNRMCYVCRAVLPSPESLTRHMKEHIACDMCDVLCATQSALDTHAKVHVGSDAARPHKCQRCATSFASRAELRKHYLDFHAKSSGTNQQGGPPATPQPQPEAENVEHGEPFRCEYCCMAFKKEQAYKRHVSLHTGYRDYNCELCNKTFNNAKDLATHHERHVNATKFACRVCNEQFDTVEAVDMHAISHKSPLKLEHKCHICKKQFRSESLLHLHMRGHLSRAHRCPMCRKAFINKTTLRIHLKTHSKDLGGTDDNNDATLKTFRCTLCQVKFDNASRLYNHILTHLEQMHGEGDDVIQSLDGIIETVQDALC